MRIIVFGATGKTGKHVVDECLARNLDVVAYVRNAQKLADRQISVVTGELTDASAIERALEGCDGIISALGSGNNTLTQFARTIVPVLEKHGPRRIVSLVGAGVGMPGDPSSFGRTAMLTLMRLIARPVLEDAEHHAQILIDSDLDWTLVRPPRLTTGPKAGVIDHAPSLKLGPSQSISRANLVAFMVETIVASSYVRQAPMVAEKAS